MIGYLIGSAMIRMTALSMTRSLGVAGFMLYICRRFKLLRLPTALPVFGVISTPHEVRNIFDNFGAGQIRDSLVEKEIAARRSPCIIDCGVNVGVTVRWWFHLNKSAKVYGIDMLREAQDFTVKALQAAGVNPGAYRPVTSAIWSERGRQMRVGVSDPLYGDYGFYRKDKEETERTVVTDTLDNIAASENIGAVDLLKIDLEGAAADALSGARELLKRTRHVVFEIHEVHNKDERRLASGILEKSGFRLRRISGRHLWWDRLKQEDAV